MIVNAKFENSKFSMVVKLLDGSKVFLADYINYSILAAS